MATSDSHPYYFSRPVDFCESTVICDRANRPAVFTISPSLTDLIDCEGLYRQLHRQSIGLPVLPLHHLCQFSAPEGLYRELVRHPMTIPDLPCCHFVTALSDLGGVCRQLAIRNTNLPVLPFKHFGQI